MADDARVLRTPAERNIASAFKSANSESLLSALRDAVEAAGFMPDGGVLAFPCQEKYPHTEAAWIAQVDAAAAGGGAPSLAALLKGGDAALVAACAELGLQVELVHYVSWPENEWEFREDYRPYEGSGCHCVTLWLQHTYPTPGHLAYSGRAARMAEKQLRANKAALKTSPLVKAIRAGSQGGWFTRRLQKTVHDSSTEYRNWDECGMEEFDYNSYSTGSEVGHALKKYGARFEKNALLVGGRAAFAAALSGAAMEVTVDVYDGDAENISIEPNEQEEGTIRCAATLRVALRPFPDRCAPPTAAEREAEAWTKMRGLLADYPGWKQPGRVPPPPGRKFRGAPLGAWCAEQRALFRRGELAEGRAASLNKVRGWKWEEEPNGN